MAVVLASATTVVLAWDQGPDNSADRLLGLQKQFGVLAQGQVHGDKGRVESVIRGWELVTVDVAVNSHDDGVSNGPVDATLTSASLPFTPDMTGAEIQIRGHGTRIVEKVNGANQIEHSGSLIPATTGLVFTTPLGTVRYDDGVVDGNVLTSATGPFSADLVGRSVVIDGLGGRVITAYTSATQVTFGGTASAHLSGVGFTMVLFERPADRVLLSSANQVLAAARQPVTVADTVVRWVFGDRRRRGAKRVVV